MKSIENYVEKKENHEEIMIRLNKILRKENSFLLGFTETIANNFDFIFRYLYAVTTLLLMAG